MQGKYLTLIEKFHAYCGTKYGGSELIGVSNKEEINYHGDFGANKPHQ